MKKESARGSRKSIGGGANPSTEATARQQAVNQMHARTGSSKLGQKTTSRSPASLDYRRESAEQAISKKQINKLQPTRNKNNISTVPPAEGRNQVA